MHGELTCQSGLDGLLTAGASLAVTFSDVPELYLADSQGNALVTDLNEILTLPIIEKILGAISADDGISGNVDADGSLTGSWSDTIGIIGNLTEVVI